MVKSRPRVVLSAAISLDGKIASSQGDSALSSKNDKKRIHALRARFDAILIGNNTARRDDPLLTVRYAKGKNPLRIIIDPRGQLSTSSRLVKTAKNIPTIIATTSAISKSRRQRLDECRVGVLIAGRKKVNLKTLLDKLYRDGIRSILLEGGGITNWEFAKMGLIDEAIITVTPHLIGGSKSPTLMDGAGFKSVSSSLGLSLINVSRRKNEVVLHYSTSKIIY